MARSTKTTASAGVVLSHEAQADAVEAKSQFDALLGDYIKKPWAGPLIFDDEIVSKAKVQAVVDKTIKKPSKWDGDDFKKPSVPNPKVMDEWMQVYQANTKLPSQTWLPPLEPTMQYTPATNTSGTVTFTWTEDATTIEGAEMPTATKKKKAVKAKIATNSYNECTHCFLLVSPTAGVCPQYCPDHKVCRLDPACNHGWCGNTIWHQTTSPHQSAGKPQLFDVASKTCTACSFCPTCCDCFTCTACDNTYNGNYKCGTEETELAHTWIDDEGFEYVDKYCVQCCECKIHHSPTETVSTLPWVGRGIKITKTQISELVTKAGVSSTAPKIDDNRWQKIWTIDNDTRDPTQNMADFYLLDGIAHMVFNCDFQMRASTSLQVIAAEAQKMAADLIEGCDLAFREYADMAIGGELRHHAATKFDILPGSRSNAWVRWRVIRQIIGPDALLDAAALFRDFTSGGIGGERWAVACEILYGRLTGKYDKRTFVDRVFTLQHNGGMFINKIPWATKNDPRWGIGVMKSHIGPAHTANPTMFGPLLAVASAPVRSLFVEWWRATNIVRRHAGQPAVKIPTMFDDTSTLNGTTRTAGDTSLVYRIPIEDATDPDHDEDSDEEGCDDEDCSCHGSSSIDIQWGSGNPLYVWKMNGPLKIGNWFTSEVHAWLDAMVQWMRYRYSIGTGLYNPIETQNYDDPSVVEDYVHARIPHPLGGNAGFPIGSTDRYMTRRAYWLMTKSPLANTLPGYTEADWLAVRPLILQLGANDTDWFAPNYKETDDMAEVTS